MFSLNRFSKSKEWLSNLWQMTFYFILKTNTFCRTVVDYCGRQLGYKYSERVNKGIQNPIHLKKLVVGARVPERNDWVWILECMPNCWKFYIILFLNLCIQFALQIFFSVLIYSWNFFCDHLSIIPYTKTMQINLDVIKNISYNYEAVIIKKISSRVSYYYNY